MIQMSTLLTVGGIFFVAVAFIYVIALTNETNRVNFKKLREAASDVRETQYKQQELLNRVEYRMARTSMQYKTLLIELDGERDDLIDIKMKSNTPYQSSLKQAETALLHSDMPSAIEALVDTNHQLLNQLALIEEHKSGTSSRQTKMTADIQNQTENQAQLQSQIEAVNEKLQTAIDDLNQKFPHTKDIMSNAVSLNTKLHRTLAEIHDINALIRKRQGHTDWQYTTIAHLALEQRFSDDPPKVGTTLCYSLIMQSDIDSGQAQTVSRLLRNMCDKYVQFGEGKLLVPQETAENAPYILGEHVIPLELSVPSGHAENWEKLNTAISYIHNHFFDYDFYLKVDPDTFFFAGNYQYFMAYMARKWGIRFVEEPLYAGLALHHHQPSYNSGHAYILNRKSLKLVHQTTSQSRKIVDNPSISLKCEWKGPLDDTFLPGCALACHASKTVEDAQALCEASSECSGVVDAGGNAEAQFQLRESGVPEPSSTGERAWILQSCPSSLNKIPFTSECLFNIPSPEDLQLGRCLYSLGVRTWDTRDNQGREFFSFTDPLTWEQAFETVLTVPWYYKGRYIDNFGSIDYHLASHIVSIHVGYDFNLMKCWKYIYDDVTSMEPGSNYGRMTLTTKGAIGAWFRNRFSNLADVPCSTDDPVMI
jgi:hypothetical protein